MPFFHLFCFHLLNQPTCHLFDHPACPTVFVLAAESAPKYQDVPINKDELNRRLWWGFTLSMHILEPVDISWGLWGLWGFQIGMVIQFLDLGSH
jgi:hypothetical protein